LLCFSVATAACERGDSAGTLDHCPDTASGERPEDCPWAAIARSFALRASNGTPLAPAIEGGAPELASDWADDADSPELLDLWGQAKNFDETANAPVVVPEIVDFLNERLHAPKRANLVTHAGVQNTYGYLFSLLKTSSGYRRARWTRGEIELGLGLSTSSLIPLPVGGSLFRNTTFFGGRIGLGDDDEAKAAVVALQDEVTRALAAFAFRDLKVKRVLETIPLDGGRVVQLRTDLVPFKAPVNDDTHVIVYSYRDSKDGRSRLLSVFPTDKATADGLLSPSSFGERADLTTRYDGYVEGVTSSRNHGTRSLVDVTPF
jgi:hypothetical protein